MSATKIADKVASKGRYGDTEIVHMAPWEVEALRRLSPTGDLTTNPETGKPEAFIFGLLAPLLAGPLGLGTGTLALAGLGAAGGAIDSIISGSDPLEGALMGGLMGGIGGGNLFGLGGDAAKAGAQAAQSGATNAAASRVGQQALGQLATPTAAMLANQGAAANSGLQAAAAANAAKGAAATSALQPGMLDGIMNWVGRNPIPTALGGVALASMLGGKGGDKGPNSEDEDEGNYPEQVPGAGQRKAFQDPSGGNQEWYRRYVQSTGGLPPLGEGSFIRRYAFGGPIGPIAPANMAPIGYESVGPAPATPPPAAPQTFLGMGQIGPGNDPYAQAMAASARMGTPQPPPAMPPSPQPMVATQPAARPMFQPPSMPAGIMAGPIDNPRSGLQQGFNRFFNASRDSFNNRPYGPYNIFRRKFADGGPVGADPGGSGSGDKTIVKAALMALLGQSPDPQAAIDAFVARFGQAALADLKQRAAALRPETGGLSGPGDGMSDSIPAAINGSEPAALSDGEYVVPADVVSGLGNGSTEAGIRQLDGLQQRVRMARGGPVVQPPPINPRKVLPA